MFIKMRYVLPLSAAVALAAGCATPMPLGARYAQMDFTQFMATAITQDDPELARRFGATRAAVHIENFTTSDVAARLATSLDDWCAAHGGAARATLPATLAHIQRTVVLGSKPPAQFYATDFGTAVSNMRVTGGQETSMKQHRTAIGRQCMIGPSSTGLVTVVLDSGLNERGRPQRSVLALLYNEKDLTAFAKSADESGSNANRDARQSSK